MENSLRWDLPLCVALIDFDHFKAYNDTFGHQAGDRLLREASQAWQQTVRSPDRLGRYGGEELILIAPNTAIPGSLVLLDRLRPLMPERQTFSSGLAKWDGAEDFDALMLRIDQALYRAKAQGRNRTVIAGEHEPSAVGSKEAPIAQG
jgi:diguanylate cyclase (GGDEF)-like protein